MKTLKHVIFLLMVILLLTTFVLFTPANAVDDGVENYTLTVENTYADSSVAGSCNFGGMSFFGVAKFDGCYGNQLSGVAREIYDSLVKSYAMNKTAKGYSYTFKTPFTFDAEISDGSIIVNDELKEIKLEIGYAIQAAMDSFLYDHPEVFWLKIIGSSYSISASGNSSDGYTGTISKISITPTEIYSGASSKISQYNTAVKSVLASVTVTQSRYETLKNIHDYICNNAWYNPVNEQRVHSSEPFFIGDGGIVCEGYAKTFKVLCDRLKIPCVLVTGYAGGAHMWNYVQMDDDKWYLVDTTWDDQQSKISDTYFLANSNTTGFDYVAITEERTEKNDFSGTGIFSFTYPALSATAYIVHVHEWGSDYTVDLKPTCTEEGSKSKVCTFTGCKAKVSAVIPATGHKPITDNAIASTCSRTGLTEGSHCSVCKAIIKKQNVVEKKAHTYKTTVTKATLSKDGKSETRCSGCGDVKATKTIYMPKTATLSATKYLYDGKAKTPSLTIKDSKDNKLVKGTDYTVSVANTRKAVGKYTVTIKFIGKYSGEAKRYFYILPNKTTKTAVKQSTSAIKIQWEKVTGATGYAVEIYDANNKKLNTKYTTALEMTYNGLKAATVYKIKIIAYKTIDGKKELSTVGTVVTTATKPSTPTLNVASTKGKLNLSWTNVSGETGYVIQYSVKKNSGFKKLTDTKVNVVSFSKSATSGKTYYFRVKSYKKVGDAYIYSDWSPVKGVKVK